MHHTFPLAHRSANSCFPAAADGLLAATRSAFFLSLALGATLLQIHPLTTNRALADEPPPPNVEPFGSTKDGQPVEAITIGNGKLTAKLITYGATLVELHVPDPTGKADDVVLGWDDVAGYESADNQYFGCTTGRVCNRIAGGKFTLDGKTYQLAVNNGPNHLHGGADRSLSKVVWNAKPITESNGQGVEFTYTSPDGEEGYPGNLKVTVKYFVPNDGTELHIHYSAESDKRTPINLTNHSYFNLDGAGSSTVLEHLLAIDANTYTEVDDTLIPTGKISSVEGTPLDFRTPTRIGERIQQLLDTPTLGYDHNFVLNQKGQVGSGPMGAPQVAAVLTSPKSGRSLRVLTNEPAIQFYSGNFLMGQTAKGGKTYPHQSAVCLETQHYPDSVNHKEFPSTILEPNVVRSSVTVFSFSTVPPQSRSSSVSESKDIPIEVDVQTVKKQLDEGHVVLIDCRETSEWETAKIEGAVLYPLSEIRENVDELVKKYAGKHVVVHCHHGGRSLRMANWLRENGFPDAQSMKGGIDAWSQEVDESVPRY